MNKKVIRDSIKMLSSFLFFGVYIPHLVIYSEPTPKTQQANYMNGFRTFVLTVLMLAVFIGKINAQECVVIMSQNYTCDNPRGFENKWHLRKGDVLHVYKDGNTYEYFGNYTAASVSIPARFCHLPGAVKGESYFIINGDGVRLREKPSSASGIYCYDENYGGSVAQNRFLVNPSKELGIYGNSYSWKPDCLPKGTRLPYLGTKNGFYKTTFNGETFYISSEYCILKDNIDTLQNNPSQKK